MSALSRLTIASNTGPKSRQFSVQPESDALGHRPPLGTVRADHLRRLCAAAADHRLVTGLQLGYESRCAKPHAYDVMLGSQLGVGSYRALVEEGLDGVMVSVSGQLDLHYVPFDELINAETLVTVVRHINYDSDFHKLARFLETNINK